MLYFVSIPNFLSHTMYSVLSCCVVLRQNISLANLLLRAPDRQSCDRNMVQSQPLEAAIAPPTAALID